MKLSVSLFISDLPHCSLSYFIVKSNSLTHKFIINSL